jgi:Zn-dependent protease with chaperone function
LFATSILISAIENFVLFSTIIGLVLFSIALVVRQLTIRQVWHPRAETLTHFYTAALIIPPLASLWLVSAALLPRLWMSVEAFEAEHAAPLHEIHLLGSLSLAIEPALAYAMALFVVVTAAIVIWSNVRGSWRVGRVIKQLDMNAMAPPFEQVAFVNEVANRSGLAVGLVMSEYPFSFVWGFRHSKLILSSGLLRTLSPVELAGVLEHEAAHHERRDNLIKLLLSLCSYSSLAFPLTRLIIGWRATEVEMICDGVAAHRTSEPLEIAEALVKLRRQTLTNDITSEPVATPVIASSFVSDSALCFQRRVHGLLALVDASPDRPTRRLQSCAPRVGLMFFAASLLALAGILLFAPLSVHHAAETLIDILR